MITRIKSDNNRIDTGALQNNNDWPGLFVRGDDCMSLRFILEDYLLLIREKDGNNPFNKLSYSAMAHELLVEIKNNVLGDKMNDDKRKKIGLFLAEQESFFNPVLWEPQVGDMLLIVRDDEKRFSEIVLSVSDGNQSYTSIEVVPIDYRPVRLVNNTRDRISFLVECLLKGSVINLKLFRENEKTLEYNASYDYIKDVSSSK